MTILEQIQIATNDAGFKGLSFANLTEFNSFVDSFQFNEFPRNVIVPYRTTGIIQPNRKQKTILIQGWALTRVSQDTNDWRSPQLEKDYIQPMRVLAEKFIMSLVNSDLTDSEVANLNYTLNPEYMLLHAHLFGVSYTFNWPIHAKLC